MYANMDLMARFVCLCVSRCESNWLNINAKQEPHEIICCDAKKGFHGVPCYNGMGLSTVLSSPQVRQCNGYAGVALSMCHRMYAKRCCCCGL